MKDFDFNTKTTKELKERLDYLLNVAVEENKERLRAARAKGGSLENQEYDAAKVEQAELHCELFELKCELAKRENPQTKGDT